MEFEAAFTKGITAEGLMQAPTGIAIYSVPDYVVKAANPFFLEMVDRDEKGLIGIPLFDAFPEARSNIRPLLDSVRETGKAYYGKELKIALRRKGKVENAFFSFLYQPLKRGDGSLEAIMVVAHEVTPHIIARRELRESEERFRLMVYKSPIPMTILRGQDLQIELPRLAQASSIRLRRVEPLDDSLESVFDYLVEG